jgi:hypothetical protein
MPYLTLLFMLLPYTEQAEESTNAMPPQLLSLIALSVTEQALQFNSQMQSIFLVAVTFFMFEFVEYANSTACQFLESVKSWRVMFVEFTIATYPALTGGCLFVWLTQ